MKITRKSFKIGTVAMALMAFVALNNQAFGQNRPEGGQKTPPTYAKLLTDMDSNKDGQLSKSEVKGPLKDQFSDIDTDGDGNISEAEFKKAPKPEKGQRPPQK